MCYSLLSNGRDSTCRRILRSASSSLALRRRVIPAHPVVASLLLFTASFAGLFTEIKGVFLADDEILGGEKAVSDASLESCMRSSFSL